MNENESTELKQTSLQPLLAAASTVVRTTLIGYTETTGLITNLASSGKTQCIVTVAERQGSDTYNLATKASGWTGQVDLESVQGETLGSFYVSNGVVTQNTVVTDHDYYVLQYSGSTLQIVAALDPVRLSSGGVMTQGGVILSNLTVQGGGDDYLKVTSFGTASQVDVSAGGQAKISGGTLSTGNNAGGVMYVSEQGVIQDFTLSGNGYLYAVSQGSAVAIDVQNCGYLIAEEGGILQSVSAGNGGSISVADGATASNTQLCHGGEMTVSELGCADNTTVLSGGALTVSRGVAKGVEIASGGQMQIMAGSATGVNLQNGAQLRLGLNASTYVAGTSGGAAFTANHGLMTGFTVGDGCEVVVQGGTFLNGTVAEGGSLQLRKGGAAENLTLLSGAVLEAGNGSLNTLTIANGGTAELYGGTLSGGVTVCGELSFTGSVNGSGVSSLKLDLEGLTAEKTASVSALDSLTDVSAITVTLSADQALGRYRILNTLQSSYAQNLVLHVEDGTANSFDLTLDSGVVTLQNGNTCRLKYESEGMTLAIMNDQEAPVISFYGDFTTPLQSTTLYAYCENEESAEIYYSTTETGEWSRYDDESGLEITANGKYYFRAVDDAGNWGSNTITITNIDRTPPEFTGSGENTATVDRYEVALTWITAVDHESGVAGYTLELNGESSWTTSTSFTTEIWQNGSYTALVTATDLAGNVSAPMLLPEFTISVHDEVILQGAPSVTVTGQTAECSWSTYVYSADNCYDLVLDGSEAVTTDQMSYTFNNLTAGQHTLQVRAWNMEATGDWSDVVYFSVEESPLYVKDLSITVTDYDLLSTWRAISAEAAGGPVTYQVVLDGGSVTSTTLNQYTATGLSVGDHTLQVRAVTDAEEGDWESRTFTVADVTPPVIRSVTAKQLNTSKDVVLTIDASDNVGITEYQVSYVDAKTQETVYPAPIVQMSGTSVTFRVADSCIGTSTGTLIALDAAGNQSSKDFSFHVSNRNTVSDYNGSGKSDMIQFVNGKVYVTYDNGSGYVQTPPVNDVTGWNVAETRRDLTGDGYADIQITSDDGAGSTWVATLRNDYLQTGCITLNYQFVGAYDNQLWSYLGSADFNGDGKSEILMVQTEAGKDPYGHRNVVAWVTDEESCLWVDNIWLGALNDGWNIAGTADLTGDGKDNLILRGADGMIGYWADFGGMPEDIVELKNAGNRILLTTGDFDGDGAADFLWQTIGGDGFSTWTDVNGSLTDTAIGSVSELGGNWSFAGVGDCNGDGKDEILWCDTTTYKTAYSEGNKENFTKLTVIA